MTDEQREAEESRCQKQLEICDKLTEADQWGTFENDPTALHHYTQFIKRPMWMNAVRERIQDPNRSYGWRVWRHHPGTGFCCSVGGTGQTGKQSHKPQSWVNDGETSYKLGGQQIPCACGGPDDAQWTGPLIGQCKIRSSFEDAKKIKF